MTKERNSSIELLRIIAMIGVVILHFNNQGIGGAFSLAANGSAKQYILYFMESLCICAVDLYILISGYYLCTAQKRSLIKIADLFIQVIVFNFLTYLAEIGLNLRTFSVRTLIRCAIPNNWFVVLYCTLYIISPFINLAINQLDDKKLQNACIISCVVFSVWPMMWDIFSEIIQSDLSSMSTVGMYGNQAGYTIINFILMYIIGALLNRNYRSEAVTHKDIRMVYVCFFACASAIFLWARFEQNFWNAPDTAWHYNNIFVIIEAVCLFIIFNNKNYHTKAVNEISKATFTCFVIHQPILYYLNITPVISTNAILMILIILLLCFAMYLFSYPIYKLYWIFYKPIRKCMMNVFDKIVETLTDK